MELRHLRYFQAVAEELHFGRAAHRLHIAQPPLSQQIRQLERELRVQLFNRSTRHVELTDAGKAYLKKAGAILDAVAEAGDQARRIAEGAEGHLAIGCVGSATYSLLPSLVRALRDSLPGVEVSVRGEMLAPAQIDALLGEQIDLALLRPPVQHPGIATHTLRRDRLLVALPSGHRLADHAGVQLGDLRGEDFVSYAGHGLSVMANLVTALCADAGFVAQVRHEAIETSTLITLVAAGLGVAIVPAPTAAMGIPGARFVPLLPDTLGIDLIAAYLATPANPILRSSLELLRNIASTDIPITRAGRTDTAY